MYTCKDAIDLLVHYLDGDMPADTRAHLENHLGGCVPCEEFLKTYRATSGLCREALAKKMPEALSANLSAFLKQNLKKSG
jgi:anti-sigma factor RsiW